MNDTTTRWFGGRSSTRATTDFDAAMAANHLAVPSNEDGTRGFTTRTVARMELMKMIGDEMLDVAELSDKYCLIRLTKILQQLLADPTLDGADEDGLRFTIYPVERTQPADKAKSAVVENFSILSPVMLKILAQFDKQDGSLVRAHGQTIKAFVKRGLGTDEGNGWLALTDKGRRAKAASEAAR